MFALFERLFASESLESSVYMWWDLLCYDWHCGDIRRERGDEDLALRDIFFDTLARILGLDSLVCEAAALHGLSHLHHPHTEDWWKVQSANGNLFLRSFKRDLQVASPRATSLPPIFSPPSETSSLPPPSTSLSAKSLFTRSLDASRARTRSPFSTIGSSSCKLSRRQNRTSRQRLYQILEPRNSPHPRRPVRP